MNHYQSGKDGYLCLVPLHRNTGKIDWVKAYGVNKILEPVGRGRITRGSKDFPLVPPEVFQEIPHRRLDLLIGLADIKIHPGCSKGFGSKYLSK